MRMAVSARSSVNCDEVESTSSLESEELSVSESVKDGCRKYSRDPETERITGLYGWNCTDPIASYFISDIRGLRPTVMQLFLEDRLGEIR